MSFEVFRRPPKYERHSKYKAVIDALEKSGIDEHSARTDYDAQEVQSMRATAKKRGYRLRSYMTNKGAVVWLEPVKRGQLK